MAAWRETSRADLERRPSAQVMPHYLRSFAGGGLLNALGRNIEPGKSGATSWLAVRIQRLVAG